MENSPWRQTAAIEELIKGREFAAQLSLLLKKTWSGDSSVAGELTEEVLSSISRALYLLDSDKSTEADLSPGSDSVCTDEAKSETCSKKRKNSAVGRGGFRKRKQSSQWRTVTSSTIHHDEYSWRKYGQKEIHSSKFPRSYFRCTHKYDQGCIATKQVQKSEEDPSVFVITYMGQHSCRSPNTVPNLIVASNSTEPSMISFGSNTSNVTQDFSLPSSSLFSKRQESEEEVLSRLTPRTPSSEIFDLPSLYGGGPMLGPVAMEAASQHGDESSGLHCSTSSLDSRFIVDSLSFGDGLFCFDHGDFFID